MSKSPWIHVGVIAMVIAILGGSHNCNARFSMARQAYATARKARKSPKQHSEVSGSAQHEERRGITVW